MMGPVVTPFTARKPAFTVATEANRVLVSARIPYELLDALQPKAKAAPAPAK